MKVEVFAGDTVIGVGELNKLDPPMGGADGPFTPTAHYNPTRHAGEIGGEPNRQHDTKLTIRGPKGNIECGAVYLADFKDALGEIELIVSGMSDFKSYFGEHPHYKQYYGLN
jgi:hypothetical protein